MVGENRGVALAIVVEDQDPDARGRVKIKFQWLGREWSEWARVVQPFASGPSFVLPKVGDEVLCAFEQSDLRHPFVLGIVRNP